MKNKSLLNLNLILFFFISCDSVFLKPLQFENEFKKHTLNSDSILCDDDFLHPSYAFLKNGKIIGVEFNGNPECGKYTRRYFLDGNEKLTKIVVEKDYFSDHCGKPFDSVYVIQLPSKQVKIYTQSTDGKITRDRKIIENVNINIDEYKDKIKEWRRQ
ncbi:hypothetical protein [Chryseobacterium sp. JAH]|uniref:hypothetical protein n=1 Tax=Chryseobacterium sp. JAH TaxID=1742858 RepID=UPI0007411541|nr:hypothetical protein [Chryseobacterium sp. JAH]KUJ52462.1 hypothetical protein AR685_05425 [Chryseobacterium sp. JAH]